MILDEADMAEYQAVVDGLSDLFMGKSKRLSMLACLSVAATTAHMIGVSKIEAQKVFVRCYDQREKEGV